MSQTAQGFSLEELVVGAAEALTGALPVIAERSEERLANRPRGAPAFLYHVPRLVVDFTVEAAERSRARWLLSSRQTEDALESDFRVELVSTAAEPRALPHRVEITVGLPRLLSFDRWELRTAIVDLLEHLAETSPPWRGGETLALQLGQAAAALAAEPPEPRPWVAALLLRTRPAARLLCLLGEGEDGLGDAVFELAGKPGHVPEEVVPVTYPGDARRGVRFDPLYRLLIALRDWEQRGAKATEERSLTGGAVLHGGLDKMQAQLREVLLEMQSAHRGAQAVLRQRSYRVGRLSGRLRATLTRERRILFRRQRGQIENTVELALEQRQGRLEARARWSLPEFVLSGDERDRVLEAVAKNRSLRDRLEEGAALDRHREASVFLAPGSSLRDRGYLVVWPGTFEGQARDLVVVARLGRKKVRRRVLLEFEDQLDGRAGDAVIAERDYFTFHRLLAALTGWFGGPA